MIMAANSTILVVEYDFSNILTTLLQYCFHSQQPTRFFLEILSHAWELLPPFSFLSLA